MAKQLVYKKTGEVVATGDKVTLPNGGALVQVRGSVLPHKPSSTGLVLVEYESGSLREFFPCVIDAEWRDAP